MCVLQEHPETGVVMIPALEIGKLRRREVDLFFYLPDWKGQNQDLNPSLDPRFELFTEEKATETVS